jgi:hypothetical protein
MTNWEKFKEVFGFLESDLVKPMVSVCVMMKCANVPCDDCPIYKNDICAKSFWSREYNKKREDE